MIPAHFLFSGANFHLRPKPSFLSYFCGLNPWRFFRSTALEIGNDIVEEKGLITRFDCYFIQFSLKDVINVPKI